MAINNSYDEEAVVQAIAKALETFYGALIEKIDSLDIKKVIKRKNPYLKMILHSNMQIMKLYSRNWRGLNN